MERRAHARLSLTCCLLFDPCNSLPYTLHQDSLLERPNSATMRTCTPFPSTNINI
nr:MAG TPA: hypothetical protein [Caudoviricetes sp.]